MQTTVLVTGKGFALYNFEPDDRQKVTCVGICADSWPPLRVAAGAKPLTGPGVDAKLIGTDPDPSGGQVVTYNGWPLYTYADDPQADIATGQATDIDGGYWFLMLPNGSPLIPSGVAAGSTTTTTNPAASTGVTNSDTSNEPVNP